MNIQLTVVARKQSANMAKRHHLSHLVEGKSLKKRVKKTGYRFKRIGENIARSRRGFSHVIQMWMHSPLHRKNILNPKFKEMGVGIVQAKNGDRYFTQVFGRPKKKK